MSSAVYARTARSEGASAVIDCLALTAIKGLGDDGIAHVLAQVRRNAATIQDFFRSPPEQLRDCYGLRAIVARSLAGQVERAREKAAKLFARANQLGIVILIPGQPEYPARLREFYDDEPPLLYAVGNLGLLSTPCIALVNSSKPTSAALDHTFGLSTRLAEAGQTLLAGAESPSYNVVGLAAKRSGGAAITVMHHGLFTTLKSGSQREPAPLVRLAAKHFDQRSSLLVSPFRLDGRWQKGNGPRRDRLVVALAHCIIVLEVKAGGTIERLCRHSIRLGRRLFARQVVVSTNAAVANESLLAKGAVPLVTDLAGSNVDQVLAASGQRASKHRLQDDDLERRRSLGQFSRHRKSRGSFGTWPSCCAGRRGVGQRASSTRPAVRAFFLG